MGMKHYWNLVDKVIRDSDIILEVVDARMPELTRNIKVENKARYFRKPFIIVLNKSDLITERMKKIIGRKLKKANFVFVSSRQGTGFNRLRKKIHELGKDKKRIYVGVVGYPNTGKSSIINCLVKKKKARTSSIAGFTKGIQWISGGKLALFDTPGVIPIDERDEVKQAIISVISPSQIKNPDLVAINIIKMFLSSNRQALEKNYKIKILNRDAEEILFSIGKSMNYLIKGGDIDVTRTAIRIINDWQNGRLLLK